MSTQAYDILQAILGQKSGVSNNTSTISTIMLFKVNSIAIHVYEWLGGAYTMYKHYMYVQCERERGMHTAVLNSLDNN